MPKPKTASKKLAPRKITGKKKKPIKAKKPTFLPVNPTILDLLAHSVGYKLVETKKKKAVEFKRVAMTSSEKRAHAAWIRS